MQKLKWMFIITKENYLNYNFSWYKFDSPRLKMLRYWCFLESDSSDGLGWSCLAVVSQGVPEGIHKPSWSNDVPKSSEVSSLYTVLCCCFAVEQ